MKSFLHMASIEHSAFVRLTLASTLQRLPVKERAGLARKLLTHASDATDHNLPLMLWYGIEPLAKAEPQAFADLAMETRIPLVRRLVARRVTEDIEHDPALPNRLLEAAVKSGDAAAQLDVLEGMCLALRGWRKAPKPVSWDTLSPAFRDNLNTTIGERANELAAVFGDGRALEELRVINP